MNHVWSRTSTRLTLPVLLALAVLPWAALLAWRSAAAVLGWAGMLAGFTGIGWLLLRQRVTSPVLALGLAPAAGFTVASAAALLAVRLESPVYPAFAALFVAAGLTGVFLLAREGRVFRGRTTAGGLGLIVLSWLAAAVHLRPMALFDGVLRDGAFTWMDVDSSYDMAITATIRGIRMLCPGSGTEDLGYHAGPYGLAGLLARLGGLEVSEALAAVKGAAQLALLGAAAGLGAALRRMTGTGRFAPLWAAAGALFLGAPQTWLNAHSYGPYAGWPAAALGLSALGLFAWSLRRPDLRCSALALGAMAVFCWLYHLKPWYGTAGVPIRGFDIGLVHFGYGHSILWGCIGLFVVTALTLDRLAADDPARPVAGLWPLAVLILASNLFAGVLALALSGTAALRRGFAWLRQAVGPGLLALLLLLVMVWALGMIHPNTPRRMEPMRPDWRAAEFASWIAWCLVWSGFAVLAFRRLRAGAAGRLFPFALAVTTLAAIALPILKGMILPCPGNDNLLYPLYFMHPLLTAIGLVAVGDLFAGLRDPADRTAPAWSAGTAATGAVLAMAVLVVALTPLRFTSRTAVSVVAIKLEVGRALALLALAWALHRGWNAHAVLRRGFAAVLAIFVGLAIYCGYDRLQPYLGGLGRNTVRITEDEYRALRAVRAAAKPSDMIATNRHSVPNKQPGRSFVYNALLERAVLMEGWGYGDASENPAGVRVLADNDRLFETRDPEVFRRLALRYGVRFVICRPGTDLQLNPRPDWIRPLEAARPLAVYAVQPN